MLLQGQYFDNGYCVDCAPGSARAAGAANECRPCSSGRASYKRTARLNMFNESFPIGGFATKCVGEGCGEKYVWRGFLCGR